MFRETYPAAWFFHDNTILRRHQPGGEGALGSEAPFKEYCEAPHQALPAPLPLSMPLGAAIQTRYSCRQFEDCPLTLAEVSTLLHASYGIQAPLAVGDEELLTRPVPSGGGLYPLELYLLIRQVTGLAPGIYHYAVLGHGLEQLERPLPPPAALVDLFVGQAYAADAALIVVVSALLARLMTKYRDRGYRLIWLEAGHLVQNLNLTAAALGCGSVNLGGFFDGELARLLGIDGDTEVPLYASAVGKPPPTDSEARQKV